MAISREQALSFIDERVYVESTGWNSNRIGFVTKVYTDRALLLSNIKGWEAGAIFLLREITTIQKTELSEDEIKENLKSRRI